MKTCIVDRVETVWSSAPDEYNYVTLEVLLDANPIVVINREKGLDNLEADWSWCSRRSAGRSGRPRP